MITCTLENGHTTSFRHVTVGALAVNKDNQILIVKRAARLINGGLWAVPGGFLDRDETCEQAVLRELVEETGLEGSNPELFQIIDNPNRPKEDRQNVHFNYIVKVKDGEFNKNDEVEESKWVSEENLPSAEEFAFDHIKFVQRYFDYLKTPFDLPLSNY